jgi:ABC-2 type transport system permease protein
MRPFVPVVILAVALIFVAVRLRQRGRIGGIASLLARRSASDAAAERSPVLGAIGLVAAREVRQRLRGRIFRVATVLLLLGVAAAVVIPAATKGKSQAVQVGVVGEAPPSLGPAITVAAARVGTDVQVGSETDTASGEDALQSGHVDVVVVDGERLVVKHEPSSGDTSQTTTFVRALAQILGANQAMQAAGLTPSQQAKLAAPRRCRSPRCIRRVQPPRPVRQQRSA